MIIIIIIIIIIAIIIVIIIMIVIMIAITKFSSSQVGAEESVHINCVLPASRSL